MIITYIFFIIIYQLFCLLFAFMKNLFILLIHVTLIYAITARKIHVQSIHYGQQTLVSSNPNITNINSTIQNSTNGSDVQKSPNNTSKLINPQLVKILEQEKEEFSGLYTKEKKINKLIKNKIAELSKTQFQLKEKLEEQEKLNRQIWDKKWNDIQSQKNLVKKLKKLPKILRSRNEKNRNIVREEIKANLSKKLKQFYSDRNQTYFLKTKQIQKQYADFVQKYNQQVKEFEKNIKNETLAKRENITKQKQLNEQKYKQISKKAQISIEKLNDKLNALYSDLAIRIYNDKRFSSLSKTNPDQQQTYPQKRVRQSKRRNTFNDKVQNL